MKFVKKLGYLVLFVLLFLSVADTVKAEQNEEFGNYSADFVPGQVIVGMKPNTQIPRSGLDRLFTELDLAHVDILLSANAGTRSAQEAIGAILLLELVDDHEQAVFDAIELLEQSPHVAYAEPDFFEYIDNSIENEELAFITRNNTPLLWNMERIGVPNAWETTRGDASIKVGIIDTGIDHTHPNLEPNLDASLAYNFALNRPDIVDSSNHGTFVAGIVGATGQNSHNMLGVAPEVTMVSLRVSDDEGFLPTSASISAIEYANEKGIQIINRSLMSDSYSQSLEVAIRSFNGLFVAIAGNSSRNIDIIPSFPASLDIPNMIVVGNSNESDQRHPSSNFGRTSVDLFAPGIVTSTVPGNAFRTAFGTSYAAPHVAGAAALALSVNPSITPVELKAAIMDAVDPVLALANLSVTGGRLNVQRLVENVKNGTPTPLPQQQGLTFRVTGEGTHRQNIILTNQTATSIPSGWGLQFNFIGGNPTLEWPASWAQGSGGNASTTVNSALNSNGTVTIPSGVSPDTRITNLSVNGILATRED